MCSFLSVVQCIALQYSTVFYFADGYEFLRVVIASSSRKGLGIIHISNLLDSNEMIGKLLVSDDGEFLNTGECNDTDFI